MRYRILAILLAVLFCSTLAMAAPAPQQPAATAQPMQMSPAQQEKELLIANINNMRNQEVRAAVLQQLLNEEIAKLRNVQALFCDKYQLDVDKFRQGMYRYDDKTGKFVLAPMAPTAAEKK